MFLYCLLSPSPPPPQSRLHHMVFPFLCTLCEFKHFFFSAGSERCVRLSIIIIIIIIVIIIIGECSGWRQGLDRGHCGTRLLRQTKSLLTSKRLIGSSVRSAIKCPSQRKVANSSGKPRRPPKASRVFVWKRKTENRKIMFHTAQLRWRKGRFPLVLQVHTEVKLEANTRTVITWRYVCRPVLTWWPKRAWNYATNWQINVLNNYWSFLSLYTT